jgi:hypothetical protein
VPAYLPLNSWATSKKKLPDDHMNSQTTDKSHDALIPLRVPFSHTSRSTRQHDLAMIT